MGNMQAESYAEGVREGWIAIDVALEAHLTSNHFPPINPVFVPVAKEAIEKFNAEEFDYVIDMPNGRSLSVSEIVDQLHLYAFLEEPL